MSTGRLFKPVTVGNVQLKHRIAMAPLTRLRADANHVPLPFVKEYYGQRASEPGTLLVTEATFISPRAGGYNNPPGIWNDAQAKAWKDVVAAVHAKGSFIFLQLWALGRVAEPDVLRKENAGVVTSASAIAFDDQHAAPTPLTEEEIHEFTAAYASAAKRAIDAGFDGVEIHGANGYLIDQFWQDVSNQRTDKYGGSVENRARFGLEVTRAVVEAVGDSKKVAMRLSPYSDFQGMLMKDPVPQFTHIIKELRKFNLAYLHLVEARIAGGSVDGVYKDLFEEHEPFIAAWDNASPILLAGGYTPEKAAKVVDQFYPDREIIPTFGRLFISTPDLPFRIRHGIEPNAYDRKTFYYPEQETGYTDYPFSEQFLAQAKAAA